MKEFKIFTRSIIEKVYVVDADDYYEARDIVEEQHIDDLFEDGFRLKSLAQREVVDINELLFETDIYPYTLEEDADEFLIMED